MAQATLCSIDGCERATVGRGWCTAHYKRWKRHGDPLAGGAPRQRNRTCSIAGCERKHDANGYCSSHNTRIGKYGDPLADVPLRDYLPRGGECQIENCGRAIFGRSMCWGHYYRDWRYGDPGAELPVYVDTEGPCFVEGCRKPRDSRGYCSMHYQRLRKGTLNVRAVACGQCGKDIDLWEHEGRGRRKRPIHISRCDSCTRPANPITTAKLYERDGDACGICDKPVDMRLAYPDPMSPSVDHVIPLAAGGPNTPENCALSHFRCNTHKRARVGFKIADNEAAALAIL